MKQGTLLAVWTGYRAGPWALRSLKAAGWEVVAMHPVDEGSGRSTACLRPRPCPSVADEEEAFVETVVRTCAEVGARAVLPMGEEAVRVLAEHAPDLGDTTLVGPDSAQYTALCDKRALGESARRVGVGTPPGVVVTAEGPAGAWPPLPSYVKTRDGVAPDRSTAAVRVEDPAARARAVAELIDGGCTALVEESIAAPQWVVHGVRSADGGFAGVCARTVRNYPRGAGSPTVSVAGPPDHPVVDATRRLFESVGYVGPGNAQFFVRDGELLVHDVNLRLPASVGIAVRVGLDVPALGVAAALGATVPPFTYTPGLRYVSIGDEVKALGDRTPPEAGGAGRGEVARDILRAALTRGTMLDPPLNDPLWIGADLMSAARHAARRMRARIRA